MKSEWCLWILRISEYDTTFTTPMATRIAAAMQHGPGFNKDMAAEKAVSVTHLPQSTAVTKPIISGCLSSRESDRLF